MACHGARRLLQMTENLFSIVGIEALTAVQGVEFRAPLKTSPELQKAAAALRAVSLTIEEDRYMANDLKAAGDLVASGRLNAAISAGILPGLES
jgi:histidine ammonia-lyase